MAMTLAEFNARRVPHTTQMFKVEGAESVGRTVMICSHIWWTEQMALALINLGYSVLIHVPLYLLYTDDGAFSQFDEHWGRMVTGIKGTGVEAIIGGNAAAMAPHPARGEMLHEEVGAPLVNYWWDEPRSEPPFARRGVLMHEYLEGLRDSQTLNVMWDRDVMEEMGAFFGVTNSVHAPLGCCPEYWPGGMVAVEKRPLAACFLGNCHFEAGWVETDSDPLVAWAREVVGRKMADMDVSMAECVKASGEIPAETRHLREDAPRKEWRRFVLPWEVLNSVWMHRTRNLLVKQAAEALGGKLALIGKGWEQLGLRANGEHAGDKSGQIYAQSRASLNLFGGCVHGGMPLRPFDITASGGVLVTHYQRELPGLFEEGKECVSFRDGAGMVEALGRIEREPARYTAMAEAGRRRTLAEHTWEKRMSRVMEAVAERWW
jgi:spore maturation protein CgeB